MERPRLAPYPERPRPTFSELFRTHKPLIGVVHLKPLPGSPGYDGQFLDLLDKALADARTIEAGGATALIVENFGDAPFYPDHVPPETVAAMTRLVTEIRKAVRIPVGVNVLRNDARAGVAVAAATGAGFVRVNVHTGVMVTDQGILQGRAWESVRLRETLRSRTLLFADVRVKHGEPLVTSDFVQEAEDAVLRGRADALIVTGAATGRPADLDRLREIKKRMPAIPVLVGSGVTLTSIEDVLQVADGCIVGTALKVDGRIDAPVDFERVRGLAEVAERLSPRIYGERPPRTSAGGPGRYESPRREREEAPAWAEGNDRSEGRGYERSERRDYERPEAPAFERLETPAFERQDAPAFERNEAPAFERPEETHAAPYRDEAPAEARAREPRPARHEPPPVDVPEPESSYPPSPDVDNEPPAVHFGRSLVRKRRR